MPETCPMCGSDQPGIRKAPIKLVRRGEYEPCYNEAFHSPPTPTSGAQDGTDGQAISRQPVTATRAESVKVGSTDRPSDPVKPEPGSAEEAHTAADLAMAGYQMDVERGIQATRNGNLHRAIDRAIEAAVDETIAAAQTCGGDGPDPHGQAMHCEACLADEQGKAAFALRTRPDYNFRCQRCGAPHNLDTSVPSDIWNQIVERDSPSGDKYGALCTLCIDDLAAEKGLRCEVEFYFVGKAVTGKLYGEDAITSAEAAARVKALWEALSISFDADPSPDLLWRRRALREMLASARAAQSRKPSP